GTTTVDLGNGETMTLPPGATLKIISTSTPSAAPKAPSLTGTITFGPGVSPDVQTALRSQENTLISEIKANPARLDLWLQLGVDRKIAGDYTGAAAVWGYVAAFKSNVQYIAYGNLGDRKSTRLNSSHANISYA